MDLVSSSLRAQGLILLVTHCRIEREPTELDRTHSCPRTRTHPWEQTAIPLLLSASCLHTYTHTPWSNISTCISHTCLNRQSGFCLSQINKTNFRCTQGRIKPNMKGEKEGGRKRRALTCRLRCFCGRRGMDRTCRRSPFCPTCSHRTASSLTPEEQGEWKRWRG